MKNRTRSFVCLTHAVSAALALCVAPATRAADVDFIGAAGVPTTWHLEASWANNQIPTSNDVLYFSGGRIAEITAPAFANNVRVGTNGGQSGELRVSSGSLTQGGVFVLGIDGDGIASFTGGDLTANRFESAIAGASSAALSISAANFTINGEAFFGLRGPLTANISGGTVFAHRFQVGQENEPNARGIVDQSGGSVTARDVIVLGEVSPNANRWSVSGGTLTTPEIYVGANGRGTFEVAGTGTANVFGQMHVAAGGSATGTLNVSGGTLNMTGPNGWILVGQNGIGSANLSGGQINTKIITVGQDPPSTGTVTHTGTALRAEYTLVVGEASANNNVYNLTGGSIEVGTEGLDVEASGIFVGSGNGRGTFNISGPVTVVSHSPMLIGAGFGGFADGTVNLSSGSLSTTSAGLGGMLRIGLLAGATGLYNQSGGTASFSGPVFNQLGGTGTMTISGGSFTAPSLANNGSYTQSGGASSLGDITGIGTLVISGGTASGNNLKQLSLAVSATGAFTLVTSATAQANQLNSLTISDAGIVDLGNNDLVIDYTGSSPIASLIGYFTAGALLSNADASGLPTCLAISEASDLGVTEFNGQPVDESAVLLKYTYVGDANLDGQVDALDYERIDLAIGNSGVAGTAQGDLNYDGTVDALDYEQVDLNIGNGVGSPLAGIDGGRFIPEPASLSLILGSALLLARRNRRI
jgi:hypothetical protein